jgi:hypothetical protein
MIDTNKYEGHTIDKMTHSQAGENLWFLEHGSNFMTMNRATLDLIRAAPDLLKEVKKLQAWKEWVCALVQQHDGPHLREMLKELIE